MEVTVWQWVHRTQELLQSGEYSLWQAFLFKAFINAFYEAWRNPLPDFKWTCFKKTIMSVTNQTLLISSFIADMSERKQKCSVCNQLAGLQSEKTYTNVYLLSSILTKYKNSANLLVLLLTFRVEEGSPWRKPCPTPVPDLASQQLNTDLLSSWQIAPVCMPMFTDTSAGISNRWVFRCED